MLEETGAGRASAPAADARQVDAALAHVRNVASRSGTSFLLGMRILPRVRRDAMYAVYAFCREVDDIADEPGEADAKLAALDGWRREIARLYAGAPGRPTTLALLDPVRRFDLPRAEFDALIDGMEMDAAESMRGPDQATLELYCRRVAGAVGLLSIRIFGAGVEATSFAIVLAEALQFTNILRDLGEDAARGRLYLPAELLDRHGIATRDPAAVLAHPRLPDAARDFADRAHARFADADRLLARLDRRRLRPALLMMGVYDRLLADLSARGWNSAAEPFRQSKRRKLWAAVRHGLFRPRRPPLDGAGRAR